MVLSFVVLSLVSLQNLLVYVMAKVRWQLAAHTLMPSWEVAVTRAVLYTYTCARVCL